MRFFSAFFILPLSAFALYNGNPSLPMMPESGLFISRETPLGIKAGYEVDWVYACQLQMDEQHFPKKRGHHFESLTQFGVLTLNINDRVELFGDMGELSCRWKHVLPTHEHLSYESQPSWAWGVGGRAILAYWGNLQLSANAAYVNAHLPLSSLKVNGQSYRKRGAKIDFTPWQVGAGISYRWGWFVPYGGVDYTNLSVNVIHLHSLHFLLPQEKALFKNEIPFGVFLGAGLGLDKGFSLNVEWRGIQENGCSLSADFKF